MIKEPRPGHYDEGLHSIDYLMYALLQAARDEDALERHQWAEAVEIELWPDTFPWGDFGWAESIHHFARGIGAARSGQLNLAIQELAEIETIKAALPAEISPYFREEVFVHADAVSAWIALAEGETGTALELAKAAADRRDQIPFMFQWIAMGLTIEPVAPLRRSGSVINKTS